MTNEKIPIGTIKNFLNTKDMEELLFVSNYILESDDPVYKDARGFGRNLTVDPRVLKRLQQEKIKVAEDFFCKKLKSAFTIISAYKEGGNCYHHFDREMCKYMINIPVSSNITWPLKVDGKYHTLENNEALFMSGTKHEHGRDGELKKGEFAINAFIYYVDYDYNGVLW